MRRIWCLTALTILSSASSMWICLGLGGIGRLSWLRTQFGLLSLFITAILGLLHEGGVFSEGVGGWCLQQCSVLRVVVPGLPLVPSGSFFWFLFLTPVSPLGGRCTLRAMFHQPAMCVFGRPYKAGEPSPPQHCRPRGGCPWAAVGAGTRVSTSSWVRVIPPRGWSGGSA